MGAARGSLVSSRWVGSGYGRWHGRWVVGSVELSVTVSNEGTRKVFRIGTVRYHWPMSAHASQAFSIASCTDSEDLRKKYVLSGVQCLRRKHNTSKFTLTTRNRNAVATVPSRRNPRNLFSSSVKDHTQHNLSRSY